MSDTMKELLAMLMANDVPFYFYEPTKYTSGYIYGYIVEDGDLVRIWEFDDKTAYDGDTHFYPHPATDDDEACNLDSHTMMKYILIREKEEKG